MSALPQIVFSAAHCSASSRRAALASVRRGESGETIGRQRMVVQQAEGVALRAGDARQQIAERLGRPAELRHQIGGEGVGLRLRLIHAIRFTQ